MGRLTMGAYSYGKIKVIGNYGHVYVGKFTSIADEVKAIMVGHDPRNVSTFPFNKFSEDWPKAKNIISHPILYGNVEIGNDCWIGYGSIIMGGVKMADGTVIAAGSVVTKCTTEYGIYGGNPAKKISDRFDSKIIEELMRIKWWHWDISKIAAFSDLLCTNNIEEFIRIHKTELKG